MRKNEQFPWPMEEGTAVDFADGVLWLVVKDDEWNDAQLESAKEPFEVKVCETNGLVIFLLEGGPLDTSDFYFNIQECDEKDALLAQDNLEVKAVLLDAENVIRVIKSATLSKETTGVIDGLFERQEKTEFMPGEYDVNVSGLQSAYLPAELAKFAKCSFEMK